MLEPITKQELIDASQDALTLEQVVNGSDTTDVTSRLARTYPTLAKALRLIVQNGLLGATAFNLKSGMEASALVDNDYAVVTDDPTPANNGFYQKRSGVFQFLAWNPINQFLTALSVETSARIAGDAQVADRANDQHLLRDLALKQLLIDQQNVTADRLSDPHLLRDLALRQTVVDQRGVAASFAQDITAFKQSVRPVTIATDAQVLELSYTLSGRVLSVQGRSALKQQGRAVYLSGDITIPTPTTGSVTGEAITLVFTTASFVFASLGRLLNAPVQSVVVSGNAGVAFTLNAEQGALVRTASGANQAATVDYSWSRVRYDLIEADPIAATLHIVTGTERNRDVAEYRPTPTAGRIPILVVRSTAWEVTVMPYAEPERQSHTDAARIQRARARKMPNLHAKLRAGLPVVIAGYGDSRTNLGGTAASPFAANGPARDTLTTSGFMMTQGSDFIATLPLFDFGDGAGAVHTKIGWNWELLAALQARYPAAHSYLNFGIGGTDSSATGNNGTVPARLDGLTSSGATVATIAFGMNELGSTGAATTANLITIGNACIAANIDPIFIAPARPNQAGWTNTIDRWLIECQQVKAAADALGAPYIDPVLLYGADQTVWLDSRDTCASNGYNHDSIAELTAIGQLLTRIILDF